MDSGDSFAWIVGLVVCLVCLAVLFRHLASWPQCSACEVALEEVACATLSSSPSVVETVYRCPRCAEMFRDRVVGTWD